MNVLCSGWGRSCELLTALKTIEKHIQRNEDKVALPVCLACAMVHTLDVSDGSADGAGGQGRPVRCRAITIISFTPRQGEQPRLPTPCVPIHAVHRSSPPRPH